MPAGCWGKEEECSVISPTQREDEDGLTRAIIELASQYGRYALTSENLLAYKANRDLRLTGTSRQPKWFCHPCFPFRSFET